MRERWPVTPQVQVRRAGPGHGGEAGMVSGGDSPGSGAPRTVKRSRYALPSDLPGSLRHLDDAQIDGLLRAVVDEARRRGRPVGGERVPSPASGPEKPAPATGGKSKRRPLPLAPGQARLVRAAFEAGVKPAAIARQLHLSRAQVEQVLGGASAENADRPAEQLRQPQNPASGLLRRCATPHRRRMPDTCAPTACPGPSA